MANIETFEASIIFSALFIFSKSRQEQLCRAGYIHLDLLLLLLLLLFLRVFVMMTTMMMIVGHMSSHLHITHLLYHDKITLQQHLNQSFFNFFFGKLISKIDLILI